MPKKINPQVKEVGHLHPSYDPAGAISALVDRSTLASDTAGGPPAEPTPTRPLQPATATTPTGTG